MKPERRMVRQVQFCGVDVKLTVSNQKNKVAVKSVEFSDRVV